MRYFFAILLLVLTAGPVGAQRLPMPTGTASDSLLATPPAPDTAVAIRRLFAAKRKRQVILSAATLGAALGAVAVVATSNQQPSGGGGGGFGILTGTGPILDSQALAVVGIGITMVPVVLIEALLFGGWNEKQEQQTIDAWRQHKEAQFLKRRLKPKYFAVLPPKK